MIPKMSGFKVFDPVKVDISTLMEDPDNVNEHSDQDLEHTGRSLDNFGQVENLVVHKSTNKVIGGNGRLRRMLKNGWKEVLVIPVEGTESQLKTLSITLNKTGRNSEFNYGKLIASLRELEEEDEELLKLTGFPDHELVPLLASEMDLGAGFDDDEGFETSEPSTPGEDLESRGMQVQFSVGQKTTIDSALAHYRANSEDVAKTPAEILTEIAADYVAQFE